MVAQNNGEQSAIYVESRVPIQSLYAGTPIASRPTLTGPVTVRVDYGRTITSNDNSINLWVKLIDESNNGYALRARAAASDFQYELVRLDAGIATSIKLARGGTEQGNHVYRLSMTVGTNHATVMLTDVTGGTVGNTIKLMDFDDTRLTYGSGFTKLQLGQGKGGDGYYIEEVGIARKGAAAITTLGTEYHEQFVQVGGHGSGYYTDANIIIDPLHPNERGAVIVDDFAMIVKDLLEAAGADASQIVGINLRNRVGRIAPSFSDEDIAQYERETGNVVSGATYAAKRATLNSELVFPYGKSGFKVGTAWKHNYMKWWYQKLAVFLEAVRTRINQDCNCHLDVYYTPRSGEGFMGPKPTTASAEWLNDNEWGVSPEFFAQLANVRFQTAVTQPWTAGNKDYLLAKISPSSSSLHIDPGYIEYAWDTFPYSKPAPSWEPGSKEFANRIELLATAYGDPTTLTRDTFTSINHGFPGDWADFARQFYSLPSGKGSALDLGDPKLQAVSYPTGEVAIYNVSEDEVIKDVSSRWKTLKEVRNGKALNTTAIRLRAFSMIVVKP
jgi:hypothetical protein